MLCHMVFKEQYKDIFVTRVIEHYERVFVIAVIINKTSQQGVSGVKLMLFVKIININLCKLTELVAMYLGVAT